MKPCPAMDHQPGRGRTPAQGDAGTADVNDDAAAMPAYLDLGPAPPKGPALNQHHQQRPPEKTVAGWQYWWLHGPEKSIATRGRGQE